MNRCGNCGGRKGAQTRQEVRVEVPVQHEGDAHLLVVRAKLPAWRCAACGEAQHEGDAISQFELAAAETLLELGVPAGGIFRFARKALGLRAVDLAELLDVTPETVSHWENDRRLVDRKAFVVLRDLVRDARAGSTDTRRQLLAFARPTLPKGPLTVGQ